MSTGHTMTFGSLFAGIGGFDLGLERAGMKCLWQCERDKFCNKVLAKHWPEVTRYDDITTLDAATLAPVDLICGGFPCQPFSVAGKRKGAEDDRFLWPAMLKVIETVRPTWVLGENVPGLISMGLDCVLSDLEGLGYAVRAFVVPACAIDAPHRRDRLWIVAHSESTGQGKFCGGDEKRFTGTWHDGEALADTTSEQDNAKLGVGGRYGADVDGHREATLQEYEEASNNSTCRHGEGAHRYGHFWQPEPNVGRVAHGVPRRVDRLRSLGNAVVPQVVEMFGRFIMESSK